MIVQKTILFFTAIALLFCLAACTPASETGTSGTPGTITSPSTVPSTAPSATKPQFKEILLADTQNVQVKITAAETNSFFGYSLKVYLENKTDKELIFTVDDVSVNGFMCDPFWAESVAAGKKSNTSISWFASDFEDNGIQEVEEITFTLRVYDSNDFLAEDVFRDTITIQP